MNAQPSTKSTPIPSKQIPSLEHLHKAQLTITFSVSTNKSVYGFATSFTQCFSFIFIQKCRQQTMNTELYRFSTTFRLFPGMGKEVENLIMENNELLATKYDCVEVLVLLCISPLALFYRTHTGMHSILSKTTS